MRNARVAAIALICLLTLTMPLAACAGVSPSETPTLQATPGAPTPSRIPEPTPASTSIPTTTPTSDPTLPSSPSLQPTAAHSPSPTKAPSATPTSAAAFSTTLRGVKNLREVGFITGETSANQTLTKWTVGGTDLGVLFGDGPYYMAFGDTFASEGDFSSGWRSNTLAVIDTPTCATVPLFSSMIGDPVLGWADEVLASKKVNNNEMTVIPTGGFQVGSVLYMTFMSVNHWGGAGEWFCNYGGLAKSTDQGATWTKLDTVKWPGDSGFVQNAALKVGSYVYFWGIPAGRFGGVSHMRVPLSKVEDFTAYEYYQGHTSGGTPIYTKGNTALLSAAILIPGPVGELSVSYNEYVDAYLLSYYCESRWAILMHAASKPEGPFDAPVNLTKGSPYFTIYGAFQHPDFVSDGGKKIGFAMSMWLPTYNVRWMEIELVREGD
jgi:hypothetical protein